MKPVIICFLTGSLLLAGCAPKQGEETTKAVETNQLIAEATLEKENEAARETAEEEPTEEITKETAKQEPEETTEETKKDPEVLFFDTFFEDRGNWGFLCSEYEKPQNINLDELYYAGAGLEQHSMEEEERAAYEEASGWRIQYDMIRLNTSQINQHLQEKTGLTLEQMNTKLENWVYLPDYDCYYFQVSDTNNMFDECTEVIHLDSNTVQVKYNRIDRRSGVVTLKKQGGGYLFLANKYEEVLEYSDKQEKISLNDSWEYGEFSKISTGTAVLYHTNNKEPKKIVVCVNAGHGTEGGGSVKTPCHPDQTPKVTGGSTGAGAYTAAAVSGGTTFLDGTPEAQVTLAAAKKLRNRLLQKGYDVLMIRDSEDVQLDNIARTVLANNNGDCHIALHWDSTENDKGAFFMGVPDIASYRSMEPVASHWTEHESLGKSLIAGLEKGGIKIFSEGRMAMDLTQTSYSTIPSVDIELGDRASDHSGEQLDKLADGLAQGIDLFFEQQDK